MKYWILVFVGFLILGCATAAVHPAVGTVLGKLEYRPYVENSAIQIGDQWIPVLIQRLPIHWVVVQGNGIEIMVPMATEDWVKVKIGDVLKTEDDNGGGT